ncbi:patatin-like phospholipase family protein [Roseomonas sp. OT10]|uniref:patatin-like phospholipase family protein n=1 Tax=Roseomonas cutis TaxID=2897332 RepID=UPI001E3D2AF7|nr:patatin-like phospholipase family protein [Roseomonas sp. OT10]UFN47021.1 patatin-like phospholipase family protein [Roseomonas sp. OT10]
MRRPTTAPTRIAIACQGGGSHTAFTAGALRELLLPGRLAGYELVGLSGTSGGAVCAALAWAGLVTEGAESARERLAGFWSDLAAAAPWDAVLNNWAVWAAGFPVTVDVSPYAYSPAAQPTLERLLRRHLRLEEVPDDPGRRRRPALFVGAADVLNGGGTAFRGETLALEEVIASAAVPPLFQAVRADGRLWWDGLYSQNPPVRELFDLDTKPQEIWVVRINPSGCEAEPVSSAGIRDRRNQMAGNLPLDHELYLIDKINRLRAEFPVLATRYDPVTVREIALDIALDYPSKLDRSPALLQRLMARGAEKAEAFLSDVSLRVVPPAGR